MTGGSSLGDPLRSSQVDQCQGTETDGLGDLVDTFHGQDQEEVRTRTGLGEGIKLQKLATERGSTSNEYYVSTTSHMTDKNHCTTVHTGIEIQVIEGSI